MKSLTYRHTLTACYLAYITQAVINNLGPLLFMTFHSRFNISLSSLALLVSMNFGIQLLVDLASAKVIDRFGYRTAAVSANILCTLGLLSLGILPFVMSEPYWGLVLTVIINSLGGGLIEVIISPIVEALPGDRKAASMSLLHSFYCWGHVLVVILSTVYFTCIGLDSWRFLPMLWALLPLGNLILFTRVPMKSLIDESGKAMPIRAFFKNKLFLLFLLMMVCAGASEQAMSQWASFFAEAGLGVSKTLGDLLGPCSFAILMGLSRLFFGLQRGGFELKRILLLSSSICIVSYLITVFSPWPLFALIGCGICGLSVGIMWPGVFSLSSRIFPLGGTAMFAILALGGDLGCASGPGIVGVIMNSTTLNTGLLTAIIFPIILTIGIGLLYREERHT